MRRTHLAFDRFFDVRLTTDDAQAAEMTLEPGTSTGGPDNAHADSDQWLYVVSGSGRAVVEARPSASTPATWSSSKPARLTRSKTTATNRSRRSTSTSRRTIERGRLSGVCARSDGSRK